MAKFHFGLSALLLCPSVLAQSPMETISKIWNSKVQLAADVSQFAGASSVLRAMAHMPGPDVQAQAGHLDPEGPAAQCDRDFGMLCPSKFVNIGPAKGGQDPVCAGSEEYTGPCQGAYSFKNLSPRAKAQWSEECLTSWPCKTCTHDHRAPCPESWEQQGGACSPTAAYDGPCQDAVGFSSYNAEMRATWSEQCQAFWGCLGEDASSASSGTVSFLASKTLPVDGYKIRNSLYLTQPLREPEQASVNVIENEDVQSMQAKAKYRGMEDKSGQLEEQIRAQLAAMTAP